MADDAVSVRFGADTSGVTAGGGEVKGVIASIQEAVAALGAGFKALGGAAVAGLGQAATAGKEAAVAVKETAVAVNEAKESMVGFGEALIAAFAVKEVIDFAKAMAENAEQVAHTASTFGLATGEVQQLKAEAALLGVPFEALTIAMQRSDKALTTAREGGKQAGEAFKTLGINIHEPIGQVQLIHEALAGLANVQDIPTRIGLAMQLFGRNIQAIAPAIGVTKDQLESYDQTAKEFGAVNDDAQAKGLALADAMHVNQVAMMGLGNTMAQALAPAFTAIVEGLNGMIKGFIDSYNQGGIVKVLMEALSVSIRGTVLIVATFGAAIIAAFDLAKAEVDSFGAQWRLVSDQFRDQAQSLEDQVITLGKVIYDSLTNNVIGAAQDMKAGWATMQADAKKTADDFAADFAAAGKAASASVNEAMATLRGAMGFAGSLFGPGKDTKNMFGLPEGQSPFGSGGGAPPDLTSGGKGGKGGQDATAAAMQAYTDQWQHFADMQAYISGNADINLTAQEVAFWKAKLDAATVGSDLWYAVIEKYNPMLVNLQKAASSELVKVIEDQYKQEIDLQRENTREREADLKAFVKSIIDMYNEQALAHKQMLEKMKADEKAFASVTSPIVASFTNGIMQMIEGTKSFAQVLREIGQKILDDFVTRVIDPMIEKWLWKEAQEVGRTVAGWGAKNAANAAGTAAGIAIQKSGDAVVSTHDAAMAAKGAYASASQVPVIGWILGPVAAAAAYAGVEAYAAGGMDVGNWAPITQLHPYEGVLPASVYQPLKAQLAAGTFGGGGGDLDMSGHTYNFHGVSGNPSDFRQMLSDHRDALMAQIHAAYRGNFVHNGVSSPFRA